MKAFARKLGVLNFETFPACLAWFASYSSALRACKGENGSFKGPGNTLRTAGFKVMHFTKIIFINKGSPPSPQHLDCCNGFLSFSCSGFLRAPCRLQCIFQCLLGGLNSAWMLNHGFWVRRECVNTNAYGPMFSNGASTSRSISIEESS